MRHRAHFFLFSLLFDSKTSFLSPCTNIKPMARCSVSFFPCLVFFSLYTSLPLLLQYLFTHGGELEATVVMPVVAMRVARKDRVMKRRIRRATVM